MHEAIAARDQHITRLLDLVERSVGTTKRAIAAVGLREDVANRAIATGEHAVSELKEVLEELSHARSRISELGAALALHRE